jgi:hypothetical protein
VEFTRSGEGVTAQEIAVESCCAGGEELGEIAVAS